MTAQIVRITDDTTRPDLAETLLATDRCDRCGAQAQHRFMFGALDLLLCGHHFREHEDRLLEAVAASGS